MTGTSQEQPTSAADFLPDRLNLKSLHAASQACRGCHLYERATQTVFGEGLKSAHLMLIGEQPGDEEDLEGRPFVGPSGRLMDEALKEAEIERRETYVTNVVKHFKWESRGKRRLHSKPNAYEITACKPWLEAEIAVIKPRVIVCLGATAAQALLGRSFRVTRQRGAFVPSDWAPFVSATVHPSAILRVRTSEERAEARQQFIDDLRHAASALRDGG